MGLYVEKYKKLMLERQAKKEEKERIKQEKIEKKKQEKRAKHIKEIQHNQNKRAYARRRKKILAEKKKNGDEYAAFSIIICKNKRKIELVGRSWWKKDAYKIYNEKINYNKETVKFPVKIHTYSDNKSRKDNSKPVKYEILLIKKLDDNTDKKDLIKKFRNDDGTFVDNIIINDKKKHIIVAKHEWLVEETFHVYGYHPLRNRKDYNFIWNDIIINNCNLDVDTRRISVLHNKLIIQYIDDFDFVICKNNKEAERLYDKIEKDVNKLGKEYNKRILLCGDIPSGITTKVMIDKIMEKTGWDRSSCLKPSLI